LDAGHWCQPKLNWAVKTGTAKTGQLLKVRLFSHSLAGYRNVKGDSPQRPRTPLKLSTPVNCTQLMFASFFLFLLPISSSYLADACVLAVDD
jgi:hypothetical protein